jgi:2,4-dienoyl-CoA reductase-like NADH-dependent reductase (Old Yellow Enzyme family)
LQQSSITAARAPLFQPFRVRDLVLKNRVVMAPMGKGHAVGGVLDPDYPAYYRRRAEGEAGLIIGGATAVPHASAANDVHEPHFHGAAVLAAWQQACDEVHAAGGRIMPQLYHAGLQGVAMTPPPWPQMGPSARWLPPPQADGSAGELRVVGEPMQQADIDAVIDAFATAVANAQRLGFDGVELHAAHGFLIDQFFWEKTNLRTDRYGGDLRDRTRFAAEIVAECRHRVGANFPLFMRISQFKMTDYTAQLARTPADLERFLAPLVDAGVDVFDCSQRRIAQPAFADSDLNLAGWVKKLSGCPTSSCGGVGLSSDAATFGTAGVYGMQAKPSAAQLDQLCERLDRGEFDLVSVARAMLGDAQWAAKVARGADHELQPFRAELMTTLI